MKGQKIHLKSPKNWINDPNGFIFYKGYYHLFYQYFPYSCQWGTMYWGHAVSKDLVNWEHKDIALFPTKNEDQNGCFSGSAIESDGKMYLVYTGVHYNEVNPENIHICVNDNFEASQIMISSEDGFWFDNWTDKRIIIPPIVDENIGHKTHTRDPKIWRGKDAWYIILGSSIDGDNGAVLFYKSKDLYNWEYVNRSYKNKEFGWMWECPDYFEVKGGKVLLFSAMGFLKNGEREQNHTICFNVDFNEALCEMKISDEWQFMDYGLDLYAPQTTIDVYGNRVMIAWLRMPEAVEGKWIGMFCAPRIVELENNHIYFRMHPDIRKAYLKEIADISQIFCETYKVCFELQESEEVNIGGFLVYRKNNCIYTDRSAVYPTFEGAHLISETPEIKTAVLEIFVDKNIIEVFVNDGEYVISNAVYNLKQEIKSSVAKKIVLHTIE